MTVCVMPLLLLAVGSRAFVAPIRRCQRNIINARRSLSPSRDGPNELDPGPSSIPPECGGPKKRKSRTALVWLRTSLRVGDNEALSRAADLGPDGLSVLFAWEHGPVPRTPSAAFECAAARGLDRALRERHGNRLGVVRASGADDAVSAVAAAAAELRPDSLVVDASSSEHDAVAVVGELRRALRAREETSSVDVVAVTDDASLVSFSRVPSALGRSRSGGRVLRWSTFLSSMSEEPVAPPCPPPILPSPLEGSVKYASSLPMPGAAGHWAEILLDEWGEISEEEALRRAKLADTATPTPLGNAGKIGRSTRLSPYLRWGVISARQAHEAGVRKRDLLWRDWSHVCYRVTGPLRRGEPVLPLLDGCCRTTTAEGENDNNLNDKDSLFAAWCLGRTGAPMVDAGMRQLWYEGWMPRHVRLLAAACLVEGLGLDWRKGRDWFEHTLIDHDPAINELMWQNAGFCGVDTYYRALKWEADGDHDYVERWSSQELSWPSAVLQDFNAQRPLPSSEELAAAAKARRNTLQARGIYKAAAKVANSGVRVAWEDLNCTKNAVPAGEVWGVGRVPLDSLSFDINQ